jgi:hypothetical protein
MKDDSDELPMGTKTYWQQPFGSSATKVNIL